MNASIHIVIVNWNSGDWLRNCLASIASHSEGCVERVTVVDNGSVDGSADLAFPELPLRIVRADQNLGFGRACNVGAQDSSSPYILFLNPDAALRPGTLSTSVSFMDSAVAADVGVCGIQLQDETGHLQRHCAYFPDVSTFVGAATGLFRLFPRLFKPLFMLDFDHLESRDVDHVVGAFYLVRRSVFKQLGGFDERFFVYLEDIDLSLRMQRHGWRVRYLAEAVAFHKGGGTSEQVKARRLYYSRKSRLLFAFKHFTVAAALFSLFATAFVEPLVLIGRGLARRAPQELSDTARGFWWLWKDLPALLHSTNSASHMRKKRAGSVAEKLIDLEEQDGPSRKH